MVVKFKRGDIVICVLTGDYGKGRPAVLIQSDLFNATHASFVVCPITSHVVEAPLFRLNLEPNKKNGLIKDSQIMVDKLSAIKADRIKKKLGTISSNELSSLEYALKTWLGLA